MKVTTAGEQKSKLERVQRDAGKTSFGSEATTFRRCCPPRLNSAAPAHATPPGTNNYGKYQTPRPKFPKPLQARGKKYLHSQKERGTRADGPEFRRSIGGKTGLPNSATPKLKLGPGGIRLHRGGSESLKETVAVLQPLEADQTLGGPRIRNDNSVLRGERETRGVFRRNRK